ncbi:Eukaryotic translation initiation factor 3 subunit H [Cichlidogyrus casuarinus]|uniref:Eukaryotic translation initiation factor 3 subunit H n=1 Tax=Cichlidogyrus casuarinus TaxID=1844966 RepID=A0ABD2QIY2_9PLAT
MNKDYEYKHNKIRVEGIALLKIIRHAQECVVLDQEGSGMVVGFGVNEVLEITNSFPIPFDNENDSNYDQKLSMYNLEMRTKMGLIQNDYTQAGLYQIFLNDTFINRGNLENLFLNQKMYPENVLLIYDPSSNMHGQIGLKAYRLAPDVYRDMLENDQKIRIEGSTKLVSDGLWECESSANGRVNFMRLLEEVPIQIHNSHLCNLMLHDIVDSTDKVPKPAANDFSVPLPSQEMLYSNTPELSNVGSLEQQLKSLLLGLDKIHDLQYTYQRKLAGLGKSSTNEIRHRDLPPIKLEMALCSADMNSFCTSLSQMAGETVGKLMLTKVIHPSSQLSNN